MDNIKSEKITKPIQLLASWLVGLVCVNSSFLITAVKISGWISAVLVIAAVVNVPLFLFAIFILQTKFRPELQEDIFYSRYLEIKTNKVKLIPKYATNVKIKRKISQDSLNQAEEKSELSKYTISINDHLTNFNDIRNAFKSKNITVKSLFGKINGTKEKPSKRIISISYLLSFQAKIELFNIILPLKFDGYSYFDPAMEDAEDILIGSYNTKATYCPFDNKFVKMLSSNPDHIDLEILEKDYFSFPFYSEEEQMENYLNNN